MFPHMLSGVRLTQNYYPETENVIAGGAISEQTNVIKLLMVR